MPNGAVELAKLLKERENEMQYTPLEGVVVELPEIKIKINEKNIPSKNMLRSIVNLLETDHNGNYIWLGRRVYLLPFFSTHTTAVQKYLVIGGDAI